jgi:hypothetical protein
MSRWSRRAGVLILMATLPALSGGTWSQESALTKQAQDAFDRGMAAFGAEDWPLAVSHLSEAQRGAHFAGNVLFNLALAHVRAGHEVAGAVWLRAYLAASPASEAAARPCAICGNRLNPDGGCPTCVKREILRLEVATESKVAKIFRQAVDLAKPLKDHAESQRALSEIIAAQEESGDTEGGLSTLRLLDEASENYAYWRDHLGPSRAAQLVAGGDLRGADEALQHVSEGYRTSVATTLIGLLLQRGDVDAVFGKEGTRYCSQDDRDAKIEGFVSWRIRDGDLTLLEQVLPRLGTGYQLQLLEAGFEKRLDQADLAGAKEAAKRGVELARRLPSPGARTAGLARFASCALRAGDEATARAAAEQMLAAGPPTETNDGLRASIAGSPPPPDPGICVRSSAVAAAILGKDEDARGFLGRYEFGCGGPHWGSYTPAAHVALIQCLGGRLGEARKTMTATIGRETGASGSGWLANSGVAILRFTVSQAKPAEALALMEDLRQQSPSAFSNVGHYEDLNLRITLGLAKAGDLEGARKAFRNLEKNSYLADRAVVATTLLLVAQALAEHKAVPDALRVLGLASTAAAEEPLGEALTKIADFQARLGDPAAAAVTRTLIRPPLLKKGVELAVRLSRVEEVVDLPTALAQAPSRPRDGTPEPCRAFDIPGQIARVACRLRLILEKERSLEK